MSEWKDIESAPKGESVLVFIPTARRDKVRLGRCGVTATGSLLWTYGGEFAFDVGKATHWQPLPPPPGSET
jgi:hypothetical protein